MKTKVIYTLISSDSDRFLYELWVSLFSLRLYEPDVTVVVLCDDDTKHYVQIFPELMDMIDELKAVALPAHYTAKQKSRELKTSFRRYIDGKLLLLDTDTVVCKQLSDIDKIEYDMAAVPEMHLPVQNMPYPPVATVKDIFGIDLYQECEYYYNSGVIYVDDNPRTQEFFCKWNENWHYSCFEKGNSQDEPSFLKADIDMSHIIHPLPDIYNAQVSMSLKWFADAAIIHWWHMSFIEDQSYSPYLGGQIYQEIKEAKGITSHADKMIRYCKQSFDSPSMPVGREQMRFLFSPAGKIFVRIYRDGGIASWLMNRLSKFLAFIQRKTTK